MRHLLFGVVFSLTAAAASAGVVTFDTLPGVNSDPFTTITEDGIAVNSLSGEWRQAFGVGNPVPSLYTLSETAALEVLTGGTFTFTSVDLGTGGTLGPEYQIIGYLASSEVLNFSGAAADDLFHTILNSTPGVVLDRLVISTTRQSTSANVDNIVLDGADIPGAGHLCAGYAGPSPFGKAPPQLSGSVRPA